MCAQHTSRLTLHPTYHLQVAEHLFKVCIFFPFLLLYDDSRAKSGGGGTSAAEEEPTMGASPADVLACGSAWLSASVVVVDVSVSRAFASSSSAFLAASAFF